jgi:hypothetical protein
VTIVWHLFKLDLHRLRWPLALFSALLVAELISYAAIAGLWQTPNFFWLARLTSGSESTIRVMYQPLFTYLLVGWMTFADSPVEHDAHWITRPVSGEQLFAAKFGGAVLIFVLWPLLLNVLWWWASGCGLREIALSAQGHCLVYFNLVSFALVCAALTGGFPQYILWSFVGMGVYMVLQMMISSRSGLTSGMVGSRFMVGGLTGAFVALAVAVHQFTTRRHQRSLWLVGGGVMFVGLVSQLWPWDFIGDDFGPGPERPDAARVQVEPTGPGQLQPEKGRYYVRLPLKLDGLPDHALMSRMSGTGEWSFAGQRVWSSPIEFSDEDLRHQVIGGVLGFKGSPSSADRFVLPLPFSPPLARRATHDPVALRASMELELRFVRLMAELPLHEVVSPVGARSCAISQVYCGPRRKNTASGLVVPPDAPQVVSLYVTDRFAGGFRQNVSFRSDTRQYALVNRRTGEFFLRDPVHSGRVSMFILNQVHVSTEQLVFNTGTVKLDDLTLAVLSIDRGELVRRDLDVNPVTFVQTVSEPVHL